MAKILIVDDSIVMRKNLRTILTDGGHEVIGEAINGKQAIISYTELMPDIVTMDISMPIMSGVDAVKHIINKDSNAKIIMISALNQKQMVFEALNNGAKHYIIKPIVPSSLLAVIEEVSSEGINNKSEIKPSVEEPGFKIDNVNGKFNVVFNKFFGVKDIGQLEVAIKGLLFIKPLNVLFDFSEYNDVSNQLLQQIQRISRYIKEADGLVEFKNIKNSIESLQKGEN